MGLRVQGVEDSRIRGVEGSGVQGFVYISSINLGNPHHVGWHFTCHWRVEQEDIPELIEKLLLLLPSGVLKPVVK